MGTWKKRTFTSKLKAEGFKAGLKRAGISTTYNIPKIGNRYVVEYKE